MKAKLAYAIAKVEYGWDLSGAPEFVIDGVALRGRKLLPERLNLTTRPGSQPRHLWSVTLHGMLLRDDGRPEGERASARFRPTGRPAPAWIQDLIRPALAAAEKIGDVL